MTTADVYAQLEAEVICQRCKVAKWINFELRHSGAKVLPPGVEFNQAAKCRPCPSGDDFTRWTGRTRWKPLKHTPLCPRPLGREHDDTSTSLSDWSNP